MLESLKFGCTVVLGYLISLGFNEIQESIYQINLENQNKSLKSDISICQRKIEQVKGVVKRW
ncbi:hypothetical protein PCC7811_04687 [Planktothrix agardhii]|nr:hypothetical protein PCC7811_04562 [Planktothrix agardhii]CAD5985442.1 hypothetical protein PCC7811_04571 [Planktothrix agardhii]CAD5986275.1 hypothetical protein PCC7811_04682 [Planktothrix agardhii]CAD5986300.1 hypothetical protein PCC7811_04687 [Planktothrix agardhii]